MLKLMSSLNYEMFLKALNNESISKLRVDFTSLQDELFNKLLGEFIAPIEREDIFILQKWLEEEFIAICSFGLLKSQNKNFFSEEITDLLKESVLVFSELRNLKTPKKLLKLLKENEKQCKKLLFSVVDFEDDVKSFCIFKELTEKIFIKFLEIERIILNNN